MITLDPALRSFDVTHLDAGQCLIEFLGNRTHLLHTCREADFLAVVNDLANREITAAVPHRPHSAKSFTFV